MVLYMEINNNKADYVVTSNIFVYIHKEINRTDLQ